MFINDIEIIEILVRQDQLHLTENELLNEPDK